MNLFVDSINLSNTKKNHFFNLNKIVNKTCVVTLNIESIEDILSSINLNFVKINAVPKANSKQETNVSLEEYSYKQTWKQVLMESLALDCILMLDDDVRPCYNFNICLSKFMCRVPDDWEILYLGASQHNWNNIDINEASLKGYYKAHNTKGSFAVILRNAGITKVLESIDLHLPLDEIINKLEARKYVAFPNIFVTDVAFSTMRPNRSDVMFHAAKMKWNLLCYDYFRYLRLNVLFLVNDNRTNVHQSYLNMKTMHVNSVEKIKESQQYNNLIKDAFFIVAFLDNTVDIPYYYVEQQVTNMVTNGVITCNRTCWIVKK